MKRTLESQLLDYVRFRKLRKVETGSLQGELGLSARQEGELFRRMSRSRLIARVRPGLYLVPPQPPLGGVWSPDEVMAIDTLMEDCGGRYQICGPSAFNRYGFDEQMPVRVYAYNNRISGERQIGAVNLTLIKVADRLLGATETFTSPDGLAAVYSSRVRTLVDAVYDWSRFAGLPRAYGWIRRELRSKRIEAAELVEVARRYGNQGTIRRIGALLEQERMPEPLLKKLQRKIRPSASIIPWVPDMPKRGPINRQWGVAMNEKP